MLTDLNLPLPSGDCLPLAAPVSRAFVRELSQRLLQDPEIRTEPALVALGYWFRDTAVDRWLAATFPAGRCFVPRGTVFHIPPGNVETNYLYVWLLSVLVGNRNIVRLPSRESTLGGQVQSLLQDLFARKHFARLRDMNQMVRYQHEHTITAYYSRHCDLRVVSGGDHTVQELRQIPLPATAIELNLVAKTSFVVLDVATICDADEKQLNDWARGLWQDVSGFDQMACNSPRAIWWLGASDPQFQAARERFWASFDRVADSLGAPWSVSGIVQREGQLDACGTSGLGARLVSAPGAVVQRVWLPRAMWADEWFGGSGVLFETAIDELTELQPHLSRRQQTVSSVGVSADRWRAFLTDSAVGGIDRIVTLGQSLTFAAVWDGFDLGRVLTREISVTN